MLLSYAEVDKHLRKGEFQESKRETVAEYRCMGTAGVFPQRAIPAYCCAKAAMLHLQAHAAKGNSGFPAWSGSTASVQARDRL